MKWFNTTKIAFSFGLVLFFYTAVAANDPTNGNNNWFEKKKVLTFSYTLKSSDQITINNQFGDVKFKIWDKDMIRVDVTVIANAPTEERADDFLKTVDIQSNQSGDLVSFKTDINRSKWGNNMNWSNNPDNRNELKVDYMVYVPNNHPLTLRNSFGDVYLPEFQSVVDVKQNYGTLYADHIRNAGSTINVAFGKAFIKSMNGGSLKAEYSVLLLDEADKTKLQNSFGKINAKRLIDVNGIISYSSGIIETIKQNANFKINFSDGLKFGTFDDDAKLINIDCNYSTVEIPLPQSVQFDVKSTYGKVNFPDDREVRFSTNSETEKNKGYNPTKVYIGNVGEGETDKKVIIRTQYGNVKIK